MTFDTGLAVTVMVPENANAMSVIVLVPPNVKDKTSGLLGTWNDDTDDDVQTPTGDIIDAREDPYVLHHSYGITCKYQQAFCFFVCLFFFLKNKLTVECRNLNTYVGITCASILTVQQAPPSEKRKRN